MKLLLVLALGLAAVAAAPKKPERIVGGSVTTIQNYPYMAAVLFAWWNDSRFQFRCGSTIVNSRSVLSAAHCFETYAHNRFRIRVGSTNADSGGVVHNGQRYLNHPNYSRTTLDSDIALFRITSTITFNNSARQGSIPGTNYNLGDNQVVWAVGWGITREGGSAPSPRQLRHVQVWTVNQNTCRSRYSRLTANMLCAGWLDVGGRDTCQGDSGGPLFHNKVVVGVTSFGNGCGRPRYPGVYVRVTRFSTWIRNNA